MPERDGRALSHESLAEIRARAVERVIMGGESPAVVSQALGFHRSVIYKWLGSFRKGGMAALAARPVPGRPSKLGPVQLSMLSSIIVGKSPTELHFKYALWTRAMIRELIWREFRVSLSESAVGRLLLRLGFTPQRPLFRAYHQDPEAAQRCLATEYPALAHRASRENAVVYFQDESAIRSDYQSGATWEQRGKTPVVKNTGVPRCSLNMLSAVSAQGRLRFMLIEGRVNCTVFLEFLQRMMYNQERPVFLITDNYPAHRAQVVARYVAETKGRLQLFFLLHSSELNPDELVWRHVKHHRVGGRTMTGPAGFAICS